MTESQKREEWMWVQNRSFGARENTTELVPLRSVESYVLQLDQKPSDMLGVRHDLGVHLFQSQY